ncbi:sodium:alanine symporter family protein [Dietzia maris]|uniref:Sodium:alanine symporter family protein n=1 Tax=Dietzia maris TaxID=37915 RepID=A0A365PCH2_9ACTN|nr:MULTISPECIES: sodium:alanine symporter family protein [Dietzia]MDN4506397.1 sodium:alanine symporter family protein [Dietzia maris]MDV3354798.1 sodium:alanine symporter family protein [Dietzia sp. IN118]RBA39091.1 sodium:alanine symporter family protein [Dietzia maris]
MFPPVEDINTFLADIGSVIWGPFVLIPLLLGTGLFLTIRLRMLQFRKLVPALRLGLLKRKDDGGEGDISQYQALTTALAATVGVGNIVGVATAIALGGPGALFWMWITALVGMASKYSEAFLGVRFRVTDARGEQSGGPQYYLHRGFAELFGRTGGRIGLVLSVVFAVFAVLASFGIGNMTQGNAVATQLDNSFGVPHVTTGIVMFVLTGAVLLGGIKAIGRVTAGFVPLMIVLYLVGGTVVLVVNAGQIPSAFGQIFSDAFTGTSAVGGFVGSAILYAIQMGVARGIFSNESGMGSAAIAAAAAKTTHPARQGLVSMTQTFIDTIIVVTFTGLVLVTTGVWQEGSDSAGTMTADAFGSAIPEGDKLVAVSIAFFAFSTILGWSYYGERCMERLVGARGVIPYRMVFTCVVFVGAVTELEVVWNFADVMNGLMAIPNLIGLLVLSGLIVRETRHYLDNDPGLTATASQVKEFTGAGQR